MKNIALLLFLFAQPANADIVRMRPFEKGNRSVGLQIGVARPTEPSFSETVRTGPDINIQALYYQWDWIAVGTELNFTRFLSKQFGAPAGLRTVPASTDLSSSAQAISLSVLTRVNFFESGTWSPYMLGGVGMSRFEQTVDAVVPGATAGTFDTTITKGNSTAMVISAGLGIEVFTVRDASLSVEARFRQYNLDEAIFLSDAQSVSLAFGFHFWWGRDW